MASAVPIPKPSDRCEEGDGEAEAEAEDGQQRPRRRRAARTVVKGTSEKKESTRKANKSGSALLKRPIGRRMRVAMACVRRLRMATPVTDATARRRPKRRRCACRPLSAVSEIPSLSLLPRRFLPPLFWFDDDDDEEENAAPQASRAAAGMRPWLTRSAT